MALCVKTSLMPPVTTTCYSHLKPSVGTNSDLLCGSKQEGFALEYCLHLLSQGLMFAVFYMDQQPSTNLLSTNM